MSRTSHLQHPAWRHGASTLALLAAIGGVALAPRPADALPSFAAQTGQPCTACHVGGFGPQLTQFGREFKIAGYTQQGGDGLASRIPLSAMVLGSYTATKQDLPAGSQPQHYNVNNNAALDQISLFLAGRISDNAGGFVQGTYSDINNSFHLDQVDLRPYTGLYDVDGNDLRVGVTITNVPTVQDPFNSTFAWGFPYVTSSLAPTPAAQPILVSGFVGNAIGLSAYAWYDHRIYIEGGGYQSMSPYLQDRLGTTYGVGRTQGVAPYLRAAYVWDMGDMSAHVGALYMQAGAFPVTTPRGSDASMGANSYQDVAVDAGYQFLGDGTNTVAVEGIYVNEQQTLTSSAASYNAANGTSQGANYGLNTLRASASYWYLNTYGASVAWQKSWGTTNPILYSAAPISGSANSRPDSNAFLLEADWVPFGKDDSWANPFVNLKLGVQYTIYTQFNGGSRNYDGYGRSASGNNTLYAFAWMAF